MGSLSLLQLLLLAVVAAGPRGWQAMSRRFGPPRPWVVRLLLLLAVLSTYRALLFGILPTTHDHGFHLMRITEAEALLRRGSVLGWSDGQFAGTPPLLLYPPMASLLPALGMLAGLSLTAAQSIWLLLCLVSMPWAVHALARRHLGEWGGALAGLLALYDPGEWWVGGHFQVMEAGMAVQNLSTALTLLALADPIGLLTNGGPREALRLGLLHGTATVFHPFAMVAGALFSGALALGDLRWRALGARGIAGRLGLLLLGFLAPCAWWLVPFLAHGREVCQVGFPPWTVVERSQALADGSLFNAPWQLGASLLGLLLWLGSRRPWLRAMAAAALLATLFVVVEAMDWIPGATRSIAEPGFLDRLLPVRLFMVVRALAAMAAAGLAVLAIGRLRRTRPGPVGQAAWLLGAVGLGIWLANPKLVVPGAPVPAVTKSLGLEEERALQALVREALEGLGEGQRLFLAREDPFNHGLIAPSVLAGARRIHVVGEAAAYGFRDRFWSTDVALLGRLGGGVLIADGDIPELAALPFREAGPFRVSTVPAAPRAWIEGGPGTVEIRSWRDDEVQLELSGSDGHGVVVVGRSWFPAWETDRGPAVRFALTGTHATFDSRPAFLSAPAVDGPMQFRWRTPTSVWLGLALSLTAGLLTGALLLRLRRAE